MPIITWYFGVPFKGGRRLNLKYCRYDFVYIEAILKLVNIQQVLYIFRYQIHGLYLVGFPNFTIKSKR